MVNVWELLQVVRMASSLYPNFHHLCLPAHKREVMAGVLAVHRVAKHIFRQLPVTLPHRERLGLGKNQGLLVFQVSFSSVWPLM